ncbi:major facilitator superfamily domain-containing protein [Rhodocollybia butyracea]|uniref:Major facilitator superfamily domain-containing protein n=1 Tax=Rhodocollybia butyracea TaxID=206335 RepID=A0A9P5U0B5_9AGAR|nr:major facilitator superfamily domain-containing protein [Rhodocollybia butyracea]
MYLSSAPLISSLTDIISLYSFPEEEEEPPYSVYTKKEKWFLVLLIASSGLFSPLTANVYFPAIPTIADAFNKSTELINLTVTMYMVFQGISPMFFGALADAVGRRLIYATCLAILSVSCVGLALTPTNAYWLLMVLRCVQAAGSTSTIALGAGVIGDIAEPYERGGFMGAYQTGPLIGPAIGPIIGGALAGSLGWRSIFWFLVIAAAVACIFVLLFLPETLRSIVGNGSIKPSPLLRPIIPIVAGYKNIPANENETKQLEKTKVARKRFRNPLTLLLYPDIPLLLLFNGTVSAVYYAVTATISSLFVEIYPFLSETEVGLCFLCIGGGMTVGSLVSGRLLDREWRSVSKAYRENTLSKKGGEAAVAEIDIKKARDDPDFPIEYARLRAIPYIMIFFVGAVIGYGWCIQAAVHISAPLILQFVVGLTSILVLNAAQTVTVDLAPTQSSSVSACNNLFRGGLGAILVSVIDLILNALKPGWTYVLLGLICAALTPLVWVVIRIGPGCRQKRREKEQRENQKA